MQTIPEMLGIKALWVVPEIAGRPPYILIEPHDATKAHAYLRVWTTKRDIEWTWFRPADAIKVS